MARTILSRYLNPEVLSRIAGRRIEPRRVVRRLSDEPDGTVRRHVRIARPRSLPRYLPLLDHHLLGGGCGRFRKGRQQEKDGQCQPCGFGMTSSHSLLRVLRVAREWADPRGGGPQGPSPTVEPRV